MPQDTAVCLAERLIASSGPGQAPGATAHHSSRILGYLPPLAHFCPRVSSFPRNIAPSPAAKLSPRCRGRIAVESRRELGRPGKRRATKLDNPQARQSRTVGTREWYRISRYVRLILALGRQKPSSAAEDGDDHEADKGSPAATVSYATLCPSKRPTRWPC